jgi:hypothetical protein
MWQISLSVSKIEVFVGCVIRLICGVSNAETDKILLAINWDTPYSIHDLQEVMSGRKQQIGGIDKNWIYLKLLSSYTWYKVIDIVPASEWRHVLAEEVIGKLYPLPLREKYRYVRSALFT